MSKDTLPEPSQQDFSELKELQYNIEEFAYHHGKVVSSVEEVNYHLQKANYFLSCIRSYNNKKVKEGDLT